MLRSALLSAALLSAAAAFAQTQTFTVRTADEFIAAIGPDRIIQIEGEGIALSEADPEQSGAYYSFTEEYDGHELLISGVSNLKIIGIGDHPAKIITKPLYGDVIAFENCTGIRIEHVEAGHGPEKGQCTGGVFNFSGCADIGITRSILYGSGTEGITADGISGLQVTNSIIRGCTYSVMSLSGSKGIAFSDCEFSDNQEFDLVNVSGCLDVQFSRCTFRGNRTGTDDYSDYALLNVSGSKSVVFRECVFQDNTAVYFAKQANAFELIAPSMSGNRFTQGRTRE
ncbi:MAG: right-handed parallel beta-helix repeat-containing protein [Bacteroidia bacterium]|nr:right-handed parallel beta-helix repeat-containing protein [Bacteroidia bacterium]